MKRFGSDAVPADPGAPRIEWERGRAAADSAPEADPLIAGLNRLRSFLRAGWSFNARLAERIPAAYFSGWSL